MNYERKFHEAAPADACKPANERHLVTILSSIYLEAGLPLEAAVRSALADYECNFMQTGCV
ncbi:MAG: hypothetical protein V4710_20050 [Verrucomicrobiota bacterium]